MLGESKSYWREVLSWHNVFKAHGIASEPSLSCIHFQMQRRNASLQSPNWEGRGVSLSLSYPNQVGQFFSCLRCPFSFSPLVFFAGDIICLSLKQPLLCNTQKPDLDYAAKNSIPRFKIRAEYINRKAKGQDMLPTKLRASEIFQPFSIPPRSRTNQ